MRASGGKSVGARTGMSVSSERSGGRCARLGVTAVTKELKREGTAARGGGRSWRRGSCVLTPVLSGAAGAGMCRQRRNQSFCLRRQWVCAPEACGRPEPVGRVSAPLMRAPALHLPGRPSCLSGPSSRPASLSARPLGGRLRVPARQQVPGSRAGESRCPRAVVLGSRPRLWEGATAALSFGGCNPRPPQPNLHSRCA